MNPDLAAFGRWKQVALEHQARLELWNRARAERLAKLPRPLPRLVFRAWHLSYLARCRWRRYVNAWHASRARKHFGNPPNPNADALRRVRLDAFLADPSQRLDFPCPDTPTVSILILNYNHDSKLLECLSSILAHTSDVSYELVVADNASTDRGPEVIRRLDGARPVLFPQNLGFVRGNNQAAEIARGKYLLLLNNDTLATPGWLSALVQTMERVPGCGAVGPRFVYPDGRMQEAGAMVYCDGRVQQLGLGGDAHADAYAHVRPVDYVSGACLLIRTDFFRSVGGFDDRFAPAYYEDVDLCMAVWDAGLKVMCQPASLVVHHGPTRGKLGGVQTLTGANQAKFVDKWLHRLGPYPVCRHPNELVTDGTRSPGERVVVVAAADSPLPARLAAAGAVVTFVPLDPRTPLAWHALRQRGVEVRTFGWDGIRDFLYATVGCHDRIVLDADADRPELRDWCARVRPLTPIERADASADLPIRRAG